MSIVGFVKENEPVLPKLVLKMNMIGSEKAIGLVGMVLLVLFW